MIRALMVLAWAGLAFGCVQSATDGDLEGGASSAGDYTSAGDDYTSAGDDYTSAGDDYTSAGDSASDGTSASSGTTGSSGSATGGGGESVFMDPVSGLGWQNPVTEDPYTWEQADAYCNGLSWAGEIGWRLPTIDELRSLVRGCPNSEPGGPCGVTESCLSRACNAGSCTNCESYAGPSPEGCYWDPALAGPCLRDFWSASEEEGVGNEMWLLHFGGGLIGEMTATNFAVVRCVK